METQKTPNSQSNPEKEKWSWDDSGSLTSDYVTKLQSNSMILAEKQIHIDKRNRIKSAEENPHTAHQPTFDQEPSFDSRTLNS